MAVIAVREIVVAVIARERKATAVVVTVLEVVIVEVVVVVGDISAAIRIAAVASVATTRSLSMVATACVRTHMNQMLP